MKQRQTIRPLRLFLLFGLTAALLLGTFSMGAGAAEGYDFPPDAAPVQITLDGKSILEGEAVILQSVTYVPLRAFSDLLGADSVTWNSRTSTATITKGSTVLHVTDSGYYVEASGRYFYTPQPVRNIGNRLFVPIRPLASVFCLELSWLADSRTVALTSTGKTLKSGSSYYNANDLYWLSRIISAEAGGESLYGQIAVGNVVLNRVASRQYPNTIYGVIFDRTGGVQFSPVSMGTIYNTPTASAVRAAKICLEGYSISSRILFFMNPRLATSSWISQNRPYAFTIGNHSFYY
ncbi:MAG: cell wall hydrolase [Clostridia bacterium]|nr:cell wall hydrolase [Clostridia bacterium]